MTYCFSSDVRLWFINIACKSRLTAVLKCTDLYIDIHQGWTIVQETVYDPEHTMNCWFIRDAVSTNLYCFLVSYLPALVSRILVANTRTMFTNKMKLSWNRKTEMENSVSVLPPYRLLTMKTWTISALTYNYGCTTVYDFLRKPYLCICLKTFRMK